MFRFWKKKNVKPQQERAGAIEIKLVSFSPTLTWIDLEISRINSRLRYAKPNESESLIQRYKSLHKKRDKIISGRTERPSKVP